MELPKAGQKWGRFSIESVVERGELKAVLRANDLGLDRRVALMLVDASLVQPEAFLRDWNMAAALDHPNVIPLFDAGSHEGLCYVVTPDLYDESLTRVVREEGPFSVDRARRLVELIADALHAFHSRGGVHGTVGSQNVLLDRATGRPEQDRPYLTGFGWSSLLRATPDQFVSWDINCATPEQIRGERVDRAADVYGLACLFFEVLTGRKAFDARSDVDVLAAHLHPPPPILQLRPDLPPGLDGVFRIALAKSPGDRFSDCLVFVRAIFDAFGETTSTSRVMGAAPSIRDEGTSAAAGPEEPMHARPIPPHPEGHEDPAHVMTPRPYVEREAAYAGGSGYGAFERSSGVLYRLTEPAGPGILRRFAKRLLPEHRSRKHAIRISKSTSDATIPPEAEWVECSVFAPPRVRRGKKALIQVFAHRLDLTAEAQRLAVEFDPAAEMRGFKTLETQIRRGARLTIELLVPGADVEDDVQSMTWNSRTQSVQFVVAVPRSFSDDALFGKVTISLNSVPVGHIKFRIACSGARHTRKRRLTGDDVRIYERAFVSYATEDREKVLARVQMLRSVGIDFFQDILSLDPGDRWAKRLYSYIDECDLFLLFWSSAARGSEWVRKEVAYALERKGPDDFAPPEIKPVIIEGPPVPAPWDELAHLHFNDRMVYLFSGS